MVQRLEQEQKLTQEKLAKVRVRARTLACVRAWRACARAPASV